MPNTTFARTAYPRFPRVLTDRDLEEFFTPSEEEIAFITQMTEHDRPDLRLSRMLLLKCCQYLNFLPRMSDIPERIVNHVRSSLNLEGSIAPGYATRKTMYRHHRIVRDYLGLRAYDHPTALPLLEAVFRQAAQLVNDPADLINVGIEELLRDHYELPAFRTLDELAAHIREDVHQQLYFQIASRLTDEDKIRLDGLHVSEGPAQLSEFFYLKQPAGPAVVSEMRRIYQRLVYLQSFLPTERLLAGLRPAKITVFAGEAEVLDAGRMDDIKPDERRYALLICLLHEAQIQVRDDLVEMFLRRISLIHKRGKQALEEIHCRQQEMTEQLIQILSDVVYRTSEIEDDALLGRSVRELLVQMGGSEEVLERCEAVAAHSGNNYLPLLYRIYRPYRSLLFELLRLLQPQTTSEDYSLVEVLHFVLTHQTQTREWWVGRLDLQFASQRWRQMIVGQFDGQPALNRRALEVCIFSYIAHELRSADLYIPGSRGWADPRHEFLTWEECEPLIPDYCERLGIEPTPQGLVQPLKDLLTRTAEEADRSYPENGQLTLNAKGEFVLKRITAHTTPPGAVELRAALEKAMPERHLLDILRNVLHWTNWSRHWGPRSGHGTGLKNPDLTYLLTTFCYGCNLGPAQTARHMSALINSRTLSHANRDHVTAQKLDASVGDIINLYHRFELPHFWGTGRAAAADGTLIEIYHRNLKAQFHGRYRRVGGIAYHYVGDTYAALFTTFITCGVWEGVYLLDLFYKTRAEVHPDTLHADTQGQSTAIFALAYLLGAELMPRIRNWQDLILFRPDKSAVYRHIDTLFGDPIDWSLIEHHWRDFMQVALSIEQRRVLPSTLLRRLGVESRKNRLYQAFRELGRVIRTIFLLRYLSDPPLRRDILAMTNKVEAYHHFRDWVGFGSEGIITHNDPIEQEKRVKYNDLIANALMVQNVVDMTRLFQQFGVQGYQLNPEILGMFSPYLTRHIKRFGEYVLRLDQEPEALEGDTWILPPTPPSDA